MERTLLKSALGEAEGVVVVIVQSGIAVVVQGGDGHLQLIDHGGGQLGGGQRHAVVTGLDDTGHRSNGVTDVDTGGGVGVDVLGDQVRRAVPAVSASMAEKFQS